MKYKFLIIIFMLCINGTSNAQTLTDLTINSDRMESIRANGFNWTNPNATNNARLDITYVCNDPQCPICSSNGFGDWETYSYNWAWSSFQNSIGSNSHNGSGSIKAIYLTTVGGLAGGSLGLGIITPLPINQNWWNNPIHPNPPNTFQTSDSTKIKDTTKKEKAYYIKFNNDTTKYYENDTIYIPRQKYVGQLFLYTQNGTVNIIGKTWKYNDSSKCLAVSTCNFKADSAGTYKIKIDSANSKVITKNTIIVYENPTITFHIKDNYFSQYGFDDSAHQYLRDSVRYKAGYEIKTLNFNTEYIVPWMSLLDGQSDTIKIKKTTFDGDIYKKLKTQKLSFVSSNKKIKINGSNNYTIAGNVLYNLNSLVISANQWDNNADTNKVIGNILVITSMGDTLGKLNLSCAKPVKKKIFFVNVNTGNGFRNINKQAIIDTLNKFSHNQLMRQWELYKPTTDLYTKLDSATINGMDTMNLTAEFADTSIFLNDEALLDKIHLYYQSHKKNLRISGDIFLPGLAFKNDFEKVHFVFIFNYSLKSPNDAQTLAISDFSGYKAIFWGLSIWKDGVHELGHLLSLHHTFPEWNKSQTILYPRLNIPQFQTKNFMDYTSAGKIDVTNMFYYAQWINIW